MLCLEMACQAGRLNERRHFSLLGTHTGYLLKLKICVFHPFWAFLSHHKTMPDSPVTTLGTLRTESEMERKPEVPASTQDEAFSIAAKPEESREARPKSTLCLTSQRHPEKLPKVTGRSRRNPGFPAATRERP